MSSTLRPLLPSSEKPTTYIDTPIIRDAVNILDTHHHEADVERTMTLIFGKIYPQDEGWSIVSQYLVPEIKRPDRLIEKYTEPVLGTVGGKANFSPHIFVELKSAKGDSLEKAVNQTTSSMPQTVDKAGKKYTMYLIIVKGKRIAFFEYHNDRDNLYYDGVLNTKGAIPFNHASFYASDPQDTLGRPKYKGTGQIQVDLELDLQPKVFLDGVFLDLITDDVMVEKVLRWMKSHEPLDVDRSEASTATGVLSANNSVIDSAPFPPPDMDIDE